MIQLLSVIYPEVTTPFSIDLDSLVWFMLFVTFFYVFLVPPFKRLFYANQGRLNELEVKGAEVVNQMKSNVEEIVTTIKDRAEPIIEDTVHSVSQMTKDISNKVSTSIKEAKEEIKEPVKIQIDKLMKERNDEESVVSNNKLSTSSDGKKKVSFASETQFDETTPLLSKPEEEGIESDTKSKQEEGEVPYKLFKEVDVPDPLFETEGIPAEISRKERDASVTNTQNNGNNGSQSKLTVGSDFSELDKLEQTLNETGKDISKAGMQMRHRFGLGSNQSDR